MLPVIWHYNDGFWDTALPKYLIEQATGGECVHLMSEWADPLPRDIALIVIPGRHSCGDYEHLNKLASLFKKVVFFIIGDEEGLFQSNRLVHQDMKIWWFMPPFNPNQKCDRVAPNGWPTHAIEMIQQVKDFSPRMQRDYDWSFYGQMTHSRRIECVSATQGIPNGALVVTPGFTQGVTREEYYRIICRSKLVLCPSGPCTPDSFRFAEALEAGCVPIVDELTQYASYPAGYWNYIFPGHLPFPLMRNWMTLDMVVELYLRDWATRARECFTWWIDQKQRMVRELMEDIGVR